MALINLPVLVTTDAVSCSCGEAECFFCEPFAGMTDEEAMDLFYSCPKCDALLSEEHDEDCRYGVPVYVGNSCSRCGAIGMHCGCFFDEDGE